MRDVDVLIIYSSGTPLDYYKKGGLFAAIKKEKPDPADAVTTATPTMVNCRIIAERLQKELQGHSINVRVATASEIQDRSEILGARLVVIGTPSRFWNVSWEIKKLFDEVFSQVGALEDRGFDGRKLAAYSMAEIQPSADKAIEAVRHAVQDCNGRLGPTMTLVTSDSERKALKEIGIFVKKLLETLKEG